MVKKICYEKPELSVFPGWYVEFIEGATKDPMPEGCLLGAPEDLI